LLQRDNKIVRFNVANIVNVASEALGDRFAGNFRDRDGHGKVFRSYEAYLLTLSPRLMSTARPSSPSSLPNCKTARYTFPFRPRTGYCLSDAARRVLRARPLYSSVGWQRARQKP